MSTSLDNYLFCLNKLIRLRWLFSGMESHEEDDLLEEMDSIWWSLTEQERAEIQKIPSRSVLEPLPKKIMQDMPYQSQFHRILVDTPMHKEAA